MAKVMVVVRHLNPISEPVASAVINEPSEYVDDVEDYFNSRASEHIEDMKKRFCEFRNAKFYTYILNTL